MISTFVCLAIALHDVDTLRCATGERIRLAGIGALELNGRAARGQPSVPGDPREQRREMARLIGGAVAAEDKGPGGQLWLTAPVRLECRPTGRTFGRVAATCSLPDGQDLSCAAIRAGLALRWPRYDRTRQLEHCRRQ